MHKKSTKSTLAALPRLLVCAAKPLCLALVQVTPIASLSCGYNACEGWDMSLCLLRRRTPCLLTWSISALGECLLWSLHIRDAFYLFKKSVLYKAPYALSPLPPALFVFFASHWSLSCCLQYQWEIKYISFFLALHTEKNEGLYCHWIASTTILEIYCNFDSFYSPVLRVHLFLFWFLLFLDLLPHHLWIPSCLCCCLLKYEISDEISCGKSRLCLFRWCIVKSWKSLSDVWMF